MVIAVLKSGGTRPEASKVLMMLVIVGRRTPRFSYSSFVGMGSRSHDLGTVLWGISKINCSVAGVNPGFVHTNCWVSWRKAVSSCGDLVGEIFRDLVGEMFGELAGEIW